MNIQLLLIIGAVVILGGGAYMLTRDSGEPASQQGSDQAQTVEERNEAREQQQNVNDFTGSFADLMQRGSNMTCTFRHSDEVGMAEGTVYVAGAQNKMRGDFTYSSSAEDMPYEGGMIHDGTMIYTWSETPEGTFGMKMAVEDGGIESMYESENFENEQFDPTTEVEYDCSSWNVDQSMFVPPSGVDFMDYSAQMQQMQQMQDSMPGSSGIDCSSCDSISDETMRAQCRESLQCE